MLCHMRHATTHAGGVLSSRNARELGLASTSQLHGVEVGFAELQDALSVCYSAVRVYNRWLFRQVIGQWIGKNVLTGVWADDGESLTPLFVFPLRRGPWRTKERLPHVPLSTEHDSRCSRLICGSRWSDVTPSQSELGTASCAAGGAIDDPFSVAESRFVQTDGTVPSDRCAIVPRRPRARASTSATAVHHDVHQLAVTRPASGRHAPPETLILQRFDAPRHPATDPQVAGQGPFRGPLIRAPRLCPSSRPSK